MSAAVRPLPERKRRIVLAICDGCERESATYEGTLPRRWRMSDSGALLFCSKCSKKGRTK